jgi:hypothetical protein
MKAVKRRLGLIRKTGSTPDTVAVMAEGARQFYEPKGGCIRSSACSGATRAAVRRTG